MNQLATAAKSYGLQVFVLAALAIAFVATTPAFTGSAAVFATFERLSLVGITAAGLAVTMIAGELDMSVGSMAVLAGVVAIRLGDFGLPAALAGATCVGLILGALQGYAIGRLGINSLVFTVGTLIALRGAAWLLAGGRPITLTDFRATDPLLQRWGVFSPSSLAALGVFAIIGVGLAWTRWGRQIYAIGGARAEAKAAGVPVRSSLTLAFATSGATAALAGALASLKGASVTPESFGSLLLTAVAACLVGGISLYGGRGSTVHMMLGVLILAVLSAGMAARGAQSYVTELFTGALLLVVITAQFLSGRAGKRGLPRWVSRRPTAQVAT